MPKATERLTISMTDEDRRLLDELARIEDRSVASMLRTLLRRAAAERGILSTQQRHAAVRLAK